LKNCKVKIIKNGPYVVSGNVPLEEKVIVYQDHGNHYEVGQPLPQVKEYALCRCGNSKNMPFCDGTETASKEPYLKRAELIGGAGLMLNKPFCDAEHVTVCHYEIL
jgi:CDGSH-type Zn-finger protein